MPDTTQTIQLAIKATPRRGLERARRREHHAGLLHRLRRRTSTSRPAAPTVHRWRRDVITGRVLEVRPGELLRTTFNGHWAPDVDALPESTVTFTLFDRSCRCPASRSSPASTRGCPTPRPPPTSRSAGSRSSPASRRCSKPARRSPGHPPPGRRPDRAPRSRRPPCGGTAGRWCTRGAHHGPVEVRSFGVENCLSVSRPPAAGCSLDFAMRSRGSIEPWRLRAKLCVLSVGSVSS